jgi:hypothetical protein
MTWRQHRETIKQLNQLTNKELLDIGISRDEIDQLIWLEADKQERGKRKNNDK